MYRFYYCLLYILLPAQQLNEVDGGKGKRAKHFKLSKSILFLVGNSKRVLVKKEIRGIDS